jgi:DNA-directed RNA polymerase subunit RPC12/RpoP
MPDSVICPACRRSVLVPPEMSAAASDEVRCAYCDQRILVGAAHTAVSTEPMRAPVGSSPNDDQSVAARRLRRQRVREEVADVDIRAPGVARGYQSGSTRATVVKALFVILIVLSVASLVSNKLQLDLAQRALAGVEIPDHELISNDGRQFAIGMTFSACYVVTVIAFLM